MITPDELLVFRSRRAAEWAAAVLWTAARAAERDGYNGWVASQARVTRRIAGELLALHGVKPLPPVPPPM